MDRVVTAVMEDRMEEEVLAVRTEAQVLAVTQPAEAALVAMLGPHSIALINNPLTNFNLSFIDY